MRNRLDKSEVDMWNRCKLSAASCRHLTEPGGNTESVLIMVCVVSALPFMCVLTAGTHFLLN